MKKKIKIVGCGVSGLTVGVLLLQNGYDVEIHAEKLPNETTSSIAAAIWLPFEVKPRNKAVEWSMASYHKFRKLALHPGTGITVVPFKVLVEKEVDAWWRDAIPSKEIRKAESYELPTGYAMGFVLNAPLIETPVYLKYLYDSFLILEGAIIINMVNDLQNLSEDCDMVINCTGLGSRTLCNDESLFPVSGQIVKIEPQQGIECISSDKYYGEMQDLLAYVVPRKDCIVLGGTATKNKESTILDEKITLGIIERCRKLQPHLIVTKIKAVQVGLRPCRPEIRLEREGKIIHNYGHGGGGYTVSWGCAEEILRIMQVASKERLL